MQETIKLGKNASIRRDLAEKKTEAEFVTYCKKHKALIDAKAKYAEIQKEKAERLAKAKEEVEKAKEEAKKDKK